MTASLKVCVVGTGYVGLVTGTCLAELGHHVICVDRDEGKIRQLLEGQAPIFERGLEEMMQRALTGGQLTFTQSLPEGIREADVIFIAVGTPPLPVEEGKPSRPDLQSVEDVAREIALNLEKEHVVIINKSTVPVGTQKRVKHLIGETAQPVFSVASNPEFLREGHAVEDFMNPDRIVVGVEDARAADTLRALYQPLLRRNVPYVETSPETAELIKYAANGFLATKIAFINEMADVCENVDANIQDLARGLGLDPRIGGLFLQPGPGFGGSCFPKDIQALAVTAAEAGATSRIVEAVMQSNHDRKQKMVEKIVAACGGDVAGKRLAILGLTFKAGTDDVRESISQTVIPALSELGAILTLYDPKGMGNMSGLYPDIAYAENIRQALEQADAVVILTEWPEFASFDWSQVPQLMREAVVVDLRNLLADQQLSRHGIRYTGIGQADEADFLKTRKHNRAA